MSVVSSIKDYVEFLNTLSDSLGNDFTLSKFITETCFYILKTLQYCVYYIFSFKWLRDFTLLPVTIPQISQSIFTENMFLESGGKTFFDFLEIPSLNQNKFFLGFFNSFFLTLPITVTHIITFRRLIIQGIPAALVSVFGFIFGQTLFILCVTFGIRSILVPWLTLEPLNYIIGLLVLFQIVYSMVEENLTSLKWNNEFHKNLFMKFFLMNFILSWCEQSCIFQYLSNITLSEHPSILEGFSTKTSLANFFSHSNYILGVFLGSIVFSLLWGFFILQIKNLLVRFSGISLDTFVQTVNKTSFVLVLAFTLSSIPFYGLEYLVTGPLGFVSQDSVFKNTILDQNEVRDPVAVSQGSPNEKLNVDISVFGRGRYLIFPENPNVYSFEDLNYRGEQDWTRRMENVTMISDSKSGLLSSFTKFKKQKPTDQDISRDENSQNLNIFDQSNTLVSEKTLQENQEDFSLNEKRFIEWYNFDTVDIQSSGEEQILIETVIKNFNQESFSSDFLRDKSQVENNIEKKIKQKYYSNPLYKNLLALDIDLFLNRQPATSFLDGNFELDLYEKRFMLQSYYDSLRLYKNLPNAEKFETFFEGTKSFTNKIYNQQFKGTLRSIRRLFSLSNVSAKMVAGETNTVSSVLKYDQPLYQDNVKISLSHEEIPEIDFYKQKNTLASPFLQNTFSKPLYAGWDENLRKFIITNKLLPRTFAGSEFLVSQNWYSKFDIEKQNFSKTPGSTSQKINFSVWPKPKEFFLKEKKELPYIVLGNSNVDLFDPSADRVLQKTYEYLPANLMLTPEYLGINKQKQEQRSKFRILENLIPKRGGFIWPGTSAQNTLPVFTSKFFGVSQK